MVYSNRRSFPAFVIFGLLLLGATGCEDDKTLTGPADSGPYISHSPASFEREVSPNVTLTWEIASAKAGVMMFDLYFGKSPTPVKIASRLVDTTYKVGPLELDTRYYWRVVGYITAGDSIASPLWHFRTTRHMQFPLIVGSNWSYERIWSYSNFDPPSIEDSCTSCDSAIGTNVTVIVREATLRDSLEAFEIHTMWNFDGLEGDFSKYFFANRDGLFLAAYQEQAAGWNNPPAPDNRETWFQYKDMTFGSIRELTDYFFSSRLPGRRRPADIETADRVIIYVDPPDQELAYPVQLGLRWSYRTEADGRTFRIEKEVIGRENVVVEAGAFDCFKIQWYWDMDNDRRWDSDITGIDYLSSVGIVKREFQAFGVSVSNYNHVFLGTADITDAYSLTDYSVSQTQ